MTAIADRVSRRASLVPIPAAEVGAYIAHRLKVAGGSHTVQFAPDALTAIYELSRGLPRRINLLCDRSLEFGRQAGVTLIPRAVVEDAAEAILGEHDRREAEHAELAKLTEARPAAARRHEPTQDLDFSFDTPPRPAPEPSTLDNDLSGFQFGARGKTLSLDDAPGPALILETPPPKSKWRYLWIAIGLVVAVAAVAAAFRWFERS